LQVGITSVSAAGITTEQANAIIANTAKNTYPSADATKVGYLTVTEAVDLDAGVVADLGTYLTVTANDLTISNANLSVVSGEGTTDGTVNSLGNITIGYDEDLGANIKTASHNLVVGKHHTYSSYGGIVVGYSNSITNSYSSVSGGVDNTSSDSYSSV
jgi:hypothetical protein